MRGQWTSLFKPNFQESRPSQYPSESPQKSEEIKRTQICEVDCLEAALKSHEKSKRLQASTPPRKEPTGLPYYDTPLGRGPYLTGVARPDIASPDVPKQTPVSPSLPKPILRNRSSSPVRRSADIPIEASRPLCHGIRGSPTGCQHKHVQQRIVAPLRDLNRQSLRRYRVCSPEGQLIREEIEEREDSPGVLDRICDGVSGFLGIAPTRQHSRCEASSSSARARSSGRALHQSPSWGGVPVQYTPRGAASTLSPSIFPQRAPPIRGVSAPPDLAAPPAIGRSASPPQVKIVPRGSQQQAFFATLKPATHKPVQFHDLHHNGSQFFPPSPEQQRFTTGLEPTKLAGRPQPSEAPLPRHSSRQSQKTSPQTVFSPQSSIRSVELPIRDGKPTVLRAPVPTLRPSEQTYQISNFSNASPFVVTSPRTPRSDVLDDNRFVAVPRSYKQTRPLGTCIKKALCVGIGYIGKVCELRGAVRDAMQMKAVLSRYPYNFNTRLLTDRFPSGAEKFEGADYPTKENIKKGLEWLSEGCEVGDICVFYFSGCSSRVPDFTGNSTGEDALVPSDFGSISSARIDVEEPCFLYSDEVHDILSRNLKSGVQFTAILDCSSASTVLPVSPVLIQERDAQPKLVYRTGKPSVLGYGTSKKLWNCWTALQAKEKRLWEPYVSQFRRSSKFRGYHDDPLCIGAVVRSSSASSPALFVYEASTPYQQAHEISIDGQPAGLLTHCLLRGLGTLDLQGATFFDVFESACTVYEDLRVTGPSDLETLDQSFGLAFNASHHPSSYRFLSNHTPALSLSRHPSYQVTVTTPLSPTKKHLLLETDHSNVIAVNLRSAQEIKNENMVEAVRYYITAGFPVESESRILVSLPMGRPNPTDVRSKRQWGRRDKFDADIEEVDFNDEKLILRHEVPEVQTCLQLTLWKSTSSTDCSVAVLLVDLNDSKLATVQTWLMRDRNGTPAATVTFRLTSTRQKRVTSTTSSSPIHYHQTQGDIVAGRYSHG